MKHLILRLILVFFPTDKLEMTSRNASSQLPTGLEPALNELEIEIEDFLVDVFWKSNVSAQKQWNAQKPGNPATAWQFNTT